MEKMKVIVEQCQIDQFQKTAAEFLDTVLGMDYEKTLITDLSDLSDFSFRGKLPEGALNPDKGLKQLYKIWDQWVIARVQEKYGITLTTTVVNLVWLFNQIEQNKKTQVH